MELSKLRKNESKLLKKFQKLKYLSLGSIIPSTTSLSQIYPNGDQGYSNVQVSLLSQEQLSPEKKAEKMIDNDSCVHNRNNSEVLLSEFSNEVPKDLHTSRENKLYNYFVKQANLLYQSYKDNSNEGNTLNSDSNKQKTQVHYNANISNSKDSTSSRKQKYRIENKSSNVSRNRNNVGKLENKGLNNKQQETRVIKLSPVKIQAPLAGDAKFDKSNSSNGNANLLRIKTKHKHVQRSLISRLQQLMTNIYQEIQKKHQIKKYRIDKLQKQIQKLYVDSHQYYLAYMQAKNQNQQHQNSQIDMSAIQQNYKLQVCDNNTDKQLGNQSGQRIVRRQSEIQVQVEPQAQERELSSKLGNSEPLKQKKPGGKANQYDFHKQKLYQAKLQDLSTKIKNLKQIISKKEQMFSKLYNEEWILYDQKITFLKLLLKNGYHTSDGIEWILVKLAKNKETLGSVDLFSILDETTKKFILQDYQAMKGEFNCRVRTKPNSHNMNNINFNNLQKAASKKSLLPKICQSEGDQKNRSQLPQQTNLFAYSRLINIPRTQNSMSIYRETKNYLIDWVRQEKWKTRSLKNHLPQPLIQKQDWRKQEVKRLKNTYSQQIYEKMVRYVFGSTRYFNKFVIKKQSDKASTNLVDRRKDSLNSNTSNSDSITNNEKNNDHFRFRLLTRTRTDQ